MPGVRFSARRREDRLAWLWASWCLVAAGCPASKQLADRPAVQTRQSCAWRSLGDLREVTERANELLLVAEGGALRVRPVLDGGAFEVELQADAQPRSGERSWAVAGDGAPLPAAPYRLERRGDTLRVLASNALLVVHRHPLRLAFYDAGGAALLEDHPMGHAVAGAEVRTWKRLDDSQRFFGLGGKSGHLEKRGRAFVMWNTDRGRYWGDDDPLYQAIPFLLGLRRDGPAFGVLLDNTHRSFFDLGRAARDRWVFGAEAGTLRYYLLAGPTPKEVIERYTALVGRMPLPPRWALGYHQSRYSYDSERRVRELASRFRQLAIPCDAIHLDIDYMDRYRSFTWDRQRFPDLPGMVRDLGQQGIKVVAIVDPGIAAVPGYHVYDQGLASDHFVRRADGSLYRGQVWPGPSVFPDFVRPQTRAWWGGLHAPLVAAGVAGLWNDMNEPSVFDGPDRTLPLDVQHGHGALRGSHRRYHNVYGMLMSRATREGLARSRPDRRPFVLTRATFAGGHRYAATWTGDNVANWQHLAFVVPMTLNLGLSGQAFSGPDIGGFHGGPTAELFTRFLQLGAWMPLSRTHTDRGTPDQEPWSYGERHAAINRAAIALRYRFLPYLYSVFHQAVQRGWPVVRPLLFEFPADGAARGEEQQFLVGNAVMVAPITEAGAVQREVYFPAGSAWYDLHTRRHYGGGQRLAVQMPIEHIGVFVRAGAVLPTWPAGAVQHAGAARPASQLELLVLPGPTVPSFVYQDRGDGPPDGDDQWRVVRFEQRTGDASLTLRIVPSGKLAPPEPQTLVRVWSFARPPSAVRWQDRPLAAVDHATAGADLERVARGWAHDQERRLVLVKMPTPVREARLELRY